LSSLFPGFYNFNKEPDEEMDLFGWLPWDLQTNSTCCDPKKHQALWRSTPIHTHSFHIQPVINQWKWTIDVTSRGQVG
jgi:hypothetical protein